MKTFADRHIGIQPSDLPKMLQQVSASSVEQLIEETIPVAIRLKKPMDLPASMSEAEILDHLQGLSEKNKCYRQYIGLGLSLEFQSRWATSASRI